MQLESRIARAWFDMCLARCEEYSLPLAILCAMRPIPAYATRTQLFDWMKAELFAYRAYSAWRDLLNMLSQRTHFTPYIVLAHAVVPTPIHLRQAREVVRAHFGPLARYVVYESRGVCIGTANFSHMQPEHLQPFEIQGEAWTYSILDLSVSPRNYAYQANLVYDEIGPVRRMYRPDFYGTPYLGLTPPAAHGDTFTFDLVAVRTFESFAAAGRLGEVPLHQISAWVITRSRIRLPAISVPISQAALVRAYGITHLW